MNGEREAEPVGASRRPLAEMIKELAQDASALIHQEMALARAEVRQNLKDLTKNVAEIAVGGGIAVVGLLVLVAFTIIGLGLLLGGTYWLSSLIVGVVLLAGGGFFVASGVRGLGKSSLAPEQTMDSLRDTGSWAQHEVRELRAGLSGDGAAIARSPAPARSLAPAGAVALESRPGHEEQDRSEQKVAVAKAPQNRPPLTQPLHKRVVSEVRDDDVLGQAAKVAFFMFTSLPPALLVLFALAGIYGGDRLSEYLTAQMQQALPGSASDPNSAAAFINRFVEQVVQTSAPGPLSIGLLLGIWAGSAVFVSLTDALNRAYDITDERSWFRRRAIAIGVMIAFLLLFIVASIILLAGPQIAGALQLGGAAELAWAILQWPLALLFVVLAFFLAYYVLPNRDQSAGKGTLFKGSFIAALLWLGATFGFRLYIANFGSYGETYGFVGAILVLLLWMYLTSIVILLGGEIASEMEREAEI